MSLHYTETLIPSSLITPSIQSLLPTGYTFRSLRRSDYKLGHLDVLADLAHIGDISEAEWTERFDYLAKCEGTYLVLVIVEAGDDEHEEKRIVGTGTLVVERKFLFKLGIQGHIEDIGIKADQQGKGLGIKMLNALDLIAKEVGCYKTILDCSAKNEGFYIKCGYDKEGTEMQHYFDDEAVKYHV
ncbi:Glucosamine 6-phosphate N-acetyltransferase [Lachnellula occidentalis]|uniref:Glucosamine 6-phosphate N-acetyltransferase n=1 Tax=Lachnellula occidentalis TaxID=215460 RepID=A0A8H8RKP1_9HELO|nr:Glucosamine 6-phosphate N-acetyltransferase [Lachnellula occidentalis]